jgi:hypothetical protein
LFVGWEAMGAGSLWFWSGGEEDGWSGCKVVGLDFTEHRLEFECRSALLVERKMQFQFTMKEGLDHGPDCNTIILKKNAHRQLVYCCSYEIKHSIWMAWAHGEENCLHFIS